MATRGVKRNPTSMNQKIMEVMFGKKAAADIPSHWTDWPEPQRSIYSRMFSRNYTLASKPMINKIKAQIDKLVADFNNM